MTMAARTMVRVLMCRFRIRVIWLAGLDYNLQEKVHRAAIFASIIVSSFLCFPSFVEPDCMYKYSRSVSLVFVCLSEN